MNKTHKFILVFPILFIWIGGSAQLPPFYHYDGSSNKPFENLADIASDEINFHAHIYNKPDTTGLLGKLKSLDSLVGVIDPHYNHLEWGGWMFNNKVIDQLPDGIYYGDSLQKGAEGRFVYWALVKATGGAVLTFAYQTWQLGFCSIGMNGGKVTSVLRSKKPYSTELSVVKIGEMAFWEERIQSISDTRYRLFFSKDGLMYARSKSSIHDNFGEFDFYHENGVLKERVDRYEVDGVAFVTRNEYDTIGNIVSKGELDLDEMTYVEQYFNSGGSILKTKRYKVFPLGKWGVNMEGIDDEDAPPYSLDKGINASELELMGAVQIFGFNHLFVPIKE